MPADEFTIRTMTRAELDLALDWAAAEGWNPGLHDAACFHAADPGGFLIGRVNGEPVAVISVVKYAPELAFLGLYIVKPAYRGSGYGLRLWNAGMARLAGCCVGLDGVLAQQGNYRRSGFVLAHRNVRHQGVAGTGCGGAEAGILIPDAAEAGNVVPLAQVPFEALRAYDEGVFGAPRHTFLKAWVEAPGHLALASLRNGALVGYGVVRPCLLGSKIGPLFADDAETADRLFVALQAHPAAGTPLFIDLPEPNAAALALASRHRLRPVFETARMFAQPRAQMPTDRVFGVTSFELG